jgi:hypothetical protein
MHPPQRPPGPPRVTHEETCTWKITPRAKRSFNTVLDAHALFDASRTYHCRSTVRVEKADGATRYVFETEQELRGGVLRDRLTCEAPDGLRAIKLERTVHDDRGHESRRELVDFARSVAPLPADSFPDVSLPFLLRGQAYDRERRSVHAWISDRMVARVYYEVDTRKTVTVPAGRFDVYEVVMYPDLNDWVKMPRVLSELSKPFLPKYHLSYETAEPHRLVRFEGPLGPPGAPEVVLELLR